MDAGGVRQQRQRRARRVQCRPDCKKSKLSTSTQFLVGSSAEGEERHGMCVVDCRWFHVAKGLWCAQPRCPESLAAILR